MLDVFGNKTTDQTEIYSEYISRRLLRLDLAGGTIYGNVVKEDMKLVGGREEDAEERIRLWLWSPPLGGTA